MTAKELPLPEELREPAEQIEEETNGFFYIDGAVGNLLMVVASEDGVNEERLDVLQEYGEIKRVDISAGKLLFAVKPDGLA